jgi:hypothetical protein
MSKNSHGSPLLPLQADSLGNQRGAAACFGDKNE